jgi:hypothetical protein
MQNWLESVQFLTCLFVLQPSSSVSNIVINDEQHLRNRTIWDLIITPRKKWCDLQFSSPSPAFFWRRGGTVGEGLLILCSIQEILDHFINIYTNLRTSKPYDPNSNYNRKDSWDLIITPRKKLWLALPAFFGEGGGKMCEGLLMSPFYPDILDQFINIYTQTQNL